MKMAKLFRYSPLVHILKKPGYVVYGVGIYENLALFCWPSMSEYNGTRYWETTKVLKAFSQEIEKNCANNVFYDIDQLSLNVNFACTSEDYTKLDQNKPYKFDVYNTTEIQEYLNNIDSSEITILCGHEKFRGDLWHVHLRNEQDAVEFKLRFSDWIKEKNRHE